MKIRDIYTKYKIPTGLQLHMFRVTGVAALICENTKDKVDKEMVVSAALLHDLGNIVKFEFSQFPEFLEPEGLPYWEKTKEEFVEKYGDDDHAATMKMVNELNIPEKTAKVVDCYGFNSAERIYRGKIFAEKISIYSDMRVSPQGVTSLKERVRDLKERYVFKRKRLTEEEFDSKAEFIFKIEKQIFAGCKIAPDDVNRETVEKLIDGLKETNIKTV